MNRVLGERGRMLKASRKEEGLGVDWEIIGLEGGFFWPLGF